MKKAIIANADIFIIPNGEAKLKDFFCGTDSRREAIKFIAENNGLDIDVDNELLVDTCITSLDLGTDNLFCYGAHATVDGECTYLGVDCDYEYLPVSLFAGKKEGDTIQLTIPAQTGYFPSEGDEVLITMNLTLAQSKYRYRNYETFENAVEMSVSKYCRRKKEGEYHMHVHIRKFNEDDSLVFEVVPERRDGSNSKQIPSFSRDQLVSSDKYEQAVSMMTELCKAEAAKMCLTIDRIWSPGDEELTELINGIDKGYRIHYGNKLGSYSWSRTTKTGEIKLVNNYGRVVDPSEEPPEAKAYIRVWCQAHFDD